MLCHDQSSIIFRGDAVTICDEINSWLHVSNWIWVAYKYWSWLPYFDAVQFVYKWTKRRHSRCSGGKLWLLGNSNCWSGRWIKRWGKQGRKRGENRWKTCWRVYSNATRGKGQNCFNERQDKNIWKRTTRLYHSKSALWWNRQFWEPFVLTNFTNNHKNQTVRASFISNPSRWWNDFWSNLQQQDHEFHSNRLR